MRRNQEDPKRITQAEPLSAVDHGISKRKTTEHVECLAHINRLPKDMRQWIFHFFSRDELFIFSTVCRLWRLDISTTAGPFDIHPTVIRKSDGDIKMLNHPFIHRNVKTLTINSPLYASEWDTIQKTIGDRAREISLVINMRWWPSRGSRTDFSLDMLIGMFHENVIKIQIRASNTMELEEVIRIYERYCTSSNVLFDVGVIGWTDAVWGPKIPFHKIPKIFRLSVLVVEEHAGFRSEWESLTALQRLCICLISDALLESSDLPLFRTVTEIRISECYIYDLPEKLGNPKLDFLERFEKLKSLKIKRLWIQKALIPRFLSFISKLDTLSLSFGISIMDEKCYTEVLDALLSAPKLPVSLIIDTRPIDRVDYSAKLRDQFPNAVLYVDKYGFTLITTRKQ